MIDQRQILSDGAVNSQTNLVLGIFGRIAVTENWFLETPFDPSSLQSLLQVVDFTKGRIHMPERKLWMQ